MSRVSEHYRCLYSNRNIFYFYLPTYWAVGICSTGSLSLSVCFKTIECVLSEFLSVF